MKLILQILVGFGAFTVIIGLIQPWWVLWWTSKQNRMLVLRYYGVPMITLFVIYLLFA